MLVNNQQNQIKYELSERNRYFNSLAGNLTKNKNAESSYDTKTNDVPTKNLVSRIYEGVIFTKLCLFIKKTKFTQ